MHVLETLVVACYRSEKGACVRVCQTMQVDMLVIVPGQTSGWAQMTSPRILQTAIERWINATMRYRQACTADSVAGSERNRRVFWPAFCRRWLHASLQCPRSSSACSRMRATRVFMLSRL